MFVSLMFNLNYKYLFSNNFLFRAVSTELFIFDSVLLYFMLLLKINNGIISYYFIIMILIGFFLGNQKTKIIRTYDKSQKKNK